MGNYAMFEIVVRPKIRSMSGKAKDQVAAPGAKSQKDDPRSEYDMQCMNLFHSRIEMLLKNRCLRLTDDCLKPMRYIYHMITYKFVDTIVIGQEPYRGISLPYAASAYSYHDDSCDSYGPPSALCLWFILCEVERKKLKLPNLSHAREMTIRHFVRDNFLGLSGGLAFINSLPMVPSSSQETVSSLDHSGASYIRHAMQELMARYIMNSEFGNKIRLVCLGKEASKFVSGMLTHYSSVKERVLVIEGPCPSSTMRSISGYADDLQFSVDDYESPSSKITKRFYDNCDVNEVIRLRDIFRDNFNKLYSESWRYLHKSVSRCLSNTVILDAMVSHHKQG
eukprot:GDKJ01038808.1.p2 GENE.GDKJ01038808.1~~GDKJ01038808.1.p2  ORF type:complete len:337 (-),score=-11.24 GDKJ01038808.1:2335-3345(-)